MENLPDGLRLQEVARDGFWSLWRHQWAFHEGVWPRVFLTRNTQFAQDDAALAAIQNASLKRQNPNFWPVVLETIGASPVLPESPLQSGEGARPGWGTPNQLETAFEARQPAILVQTEALAPGWKAWVNQTPTRVERANYLFRAVAVPSGGGRAVLVYDSQTLRLSLFFALSALAVGAAFFRVSANRLRRLQPTTRSD